jgi:hypothetical protein
MSEPSSVDENPLRTRVFFKDAAMEAAWLAKSGAILVRSIYLWDNESTIWIEPGCRPCDVLVDAAGIEFRVAEEPCDGWSGTQLVKKEPMPAPFNV